MDRVLPGMSRNNPAGLMHKEEGRKLLFYAQSAITVIYQGESTEITTIGRGG